jgi:hypothetical protein
MSRDSPKKIWVPVKCHSASVALRALPQRGGISGKKKRVPEKLGNPLFAMVPEAGLEFRACFARSEIQAFVW